ncbi:hypothetical protein [Brevundimonas sp.]|uniref:hypothetical protein n=1 Tax=Brevundimonas sp. TaxID=1871086 RepID=UPI002D364487|nr:hypothetical protein [Brevundimonas sp.]HYC74276.1 hypothetical protein [Brevundimonas sp.]
MEEMVNREYAERILRPPLLFAQLMAAPLVEIRGAVLPGTPAIYAFYLAGEPVHVGRTRNLRQRLRGHVSNSHYSASFAFKPARGATGLTATYRKGEGRAALLENPVFRDAFDHALAEVQGMSVRYLAVADPIDQYLLELYAALELGTSLSEFDTH